MFKLPDIPSSIFSIMSRLAREYGAINLSPGFPDFEVDPELVSLIEKVSKGIVHQYSPMTGEPKLLEETARIVYESYGRELDPKAEILITQEQHKESLHAFKHWLNQVMRCSYLTQAMTVMLCR